MSTGLRPPWPISKRSRPTSDDTPFNTLAAWSSGFSRSERLASLPRLGPIVPEYEEETLRELFEDPYRIVYKIADQQIDIVAVIHAARKLPRAL